MLVKNLDEILNSSRVRHKNTNDALGFIQTIAFAGGPTAPAQDEQDEKNLSAYKHSLYNFKKVFALSPAAARRLEVMTVRRREYFDNMENTKYGDKLMQAFRRGYEAPKVTE